MPPESLLQQVSREIAATAAFGQSMPLQIVHDTAREGHIDAFRTGGICHSRAAGSCGISIKALLQLLNQVVENWHDIVAILKI